MMSKRAQQRAPVETPSVLFFKVVSKKLEAEFPLVVRRCMHASKGERA